LSSGVDRRNSELASSLLALPGGVLTGEESGDGVDGGYALMSDTDRGDSSSIHVRQLQAELIATQARLRTPTCTGPKSEKKKPLMPARRGAAMMLLTVLVLSFLSLCTFLWVSGRHKPRSIS
jgi:hypothetical protein